MSTQLFDPTAREATNISAGHTIVAPGRPSDSPTLGAPPTMVGVPGGPGRSSFRSGTSRGDGEGRTTVLPDVVDDNGRLSLRTRRHRRYGRVRALGVGGMGEVDLVQDLDIGRPVAIKRLALDANNPVAVARFVDEVRTMGALDHPNITPIYDVGRDDDGRYFFAMKYVDGESLESLIERLAAGDPQAHAQFPIARRLDIFAGILHALDYAHARKIVHHDIKPANVMLGQHGEVHLVDWGISLREGGTSTPGIQGTPLYMSPEQARGEELDARSDLYSAFVVLFELLTLRRYVHGPANTAALLQAVLDAKVPPGDSAVWVHPRQPALPMELRHVVRRGLQPDPQHRFTGAAAAMAFLEHLRSGEIAVECPVTMLKAQQARVGRFFDRRPRLLLSLVWLAVASGTAVLVLAGLGVLSLLS